MRPASKRLSLSQSASEFLTSQFHAIALSSTSSLLRRAGRIALTFRTRKKGRDAIPDHPIPIDELRLYCLSYRHSQDGRRRPRVAFAVYRPTLDFPGSGRITFRPELDGDASDLRTLLHPRPNYTAIRTAVVLHHAIQDADTADVATGPRWPGFSFGFHPRRSPRFDPVDLPAAKAAELAVDGLRAWPAGLFFRHGRSTLDREPARVFASLAGLKGRRIRNPAFALLREHGILPADVGYRAWLVTLSTANGGGRAWQDPRAEGTEPARLRRAIEDHLLAEPAREPALLAELAQACYAMGVKIAHGPEGVDALAELLDNPWDRPAVPYAADVQVVRPVGMPGPTSLSFVDGVAEVDLGELGHHRGRSGPIGRQGPRR